MPGVRDICRQFRLVVLGERRGEELRTAGQTERGDGVPHPEEVNRKIRPFDLRRDRKLQVAQVLLEDVVLAVGVVLVGGVSRLNVVLFLRDVLEE